MVLNFKMKGVTGIVMLLFFVSVAATNSSITVSPTTASDNSTGSSTPSASTVTTTPSTNTTSSTNGTIHSSNNTASTTLPTTTSPAVPESTTSTIVSPTTVPAVSETTILIILEIKILSVKFDKVKDPTSPEGKKFRDEACKSLTSKKKFKKLKRCKVRRLRKGSVIVEYDLVVNATSQEQAQDFIAALQEQIKTGKIGNYTVDRKHPTGAKITMQVPGKPPVPSTTDPSIKSISTTLIILFAVGFFLLVAVIILLIVLIAKIRKGQ